jgi:hypothetical protein
MLEDGIPTSAFPTRRNAFIGIEIEKNAPVSLAGKPAVTTSAIALSQSIRSEAILPISASFRTFREEARLSGVRF